MRLTERATLNYHAFYSEVSEGSTTLIVWWAKISPMRKPKGKLVALLAGAVVVVLVAVGAMFWKDVYCHLFLDPRLVGRWKSTAPLEEPFFMEFDRLGNVEGHQGSVEVVQGSKMRGRYSADGNELSYFFEGKAFIADGIEWEIGRVVVPYRLTGGNLLTLFGSSGSELTYRRVPDDS